MQPGNRVLVDDLLTPLYRPCYLKFSQPCTCQPHRRRYQIVAGISSCLLVFFWWCFAPAVTCEIHHRFSTFFVIQVYRFTSLLGVGLGKDLRI